MNRLMSRLLPIAIAGGLLLATGCGKDEGGPVGPTEVGALRDITITLQNMDSHLGQFAEFRILSNRQSDVLTPWDWLRAVARIDSLTETTTTLTLRNAVPEGLSRLDFWFDSYIDPGAATAGMHWYNAPLPTINESFTDHCYRIYLPDSGDIDVVFTHPAAGADTLWARFYAEPDTAMFLNVNEPTWQRAPLDLRMDLSGMAPGLGQQLELKVIDPTTGVDRVIGYLRNALVKANAFQLVLPDQGVEGVEYYLDFYVDLNGNGEYDAPPTDQAWRVTHTIPANADSFKVNFTHTTTFTNIIWP